jgi:hypothetical protein
MVLDDFGGAKSCEEGRKGAKCGSTGENISTAS